MTSPAEVRPFRRAHRDPSESVVGGVCAGLAKHLGWDPLWVRIGFMAATALWGVGLVAYAAFWLFLPLEPTAMADHPGLESAQRRGFRPAVRLRASDLGALVALAAVGLGLLLGGALGNLGDRLFRHPKGFPGGVVDFIQAVSWWPIFNVADAAIVVGVIILVLAYWARDRERRTGA